MRIEVKVRHRGTVLPAIAVTNVGAIEAKRAIKLSRAVRSALIELLVLADPEAPLAVLVVSRATPRENLSNLTLA